MGKNYIVYGSEKAISSGVPLTISSVATYNVLLATTKLKEEFPLIGDLTILLC